MEILRLIIAVTFTGVIVFTAIITCLSLIGKVRFKNPNQQNTLFKVLVVELIIVAVGFYSGWLSFPTGNSAMTTTTSEVLPPDTEEFEPTTIVDTDTDLGSLKPIEEASGFDLAALDNVDNLKRLFGQIFLIGVDESAFTQEDQKWNFALDQMGIGGIFLNNRNLITPDSIGSDNIKTVSYLMLKNKIARMKKMNANGKPLPRFIAIDHEGGTVGQLMKRGLATELPAQMALASLRNVNAVDIGALISARELFKLGINMVLGPVVDLNVEKQNRDIRDRSYGDQPSDVEQFADRYIKIHKRFNILTVLKHFPGHGHTLSGFDTPNPPVSYHRSNTIKTSLSPFRALSKASPAIMTSHMNIDYLGVDNVTINKRIVNDLIRESNKIDLNGTNLEGLNFSGLIVTDDMNEVSLTATRNENDYKCEINKPLPKNITEYVERLKTRSLQAFEAGHDILLFSHVRTKKDNINWIKKRDDWCARWSMTLEEFREVYEYLFESVFNPQSGEDSINRIKALKEKLARIIIAKNKYLQPRQDNNSINIFDWKEKHKLCSEWLFKNSVSLILPSGTNQSHFLKNVRSQDSAILFSFLKDKKIHTKKEENNLSDEFLTRTFWYRYHNELVKALQDKFNDNLSVVQLKNNPVRSEEALLLDKIVERISSREETPSHLVFLIDSHHAGWRVVQKFINFNKERKIIDPKFIYSIILRNPSMLRDQVEDSTGSGNFNTLDTNIVVFYSSYSKGTKYQIDSLFEYNGTEPTSFLPIVIENTNPSVKPIIDLPLIPKAEVKDVCRF